MRTKMAIAILLLTAAAHAQEHMSDTLRNGILEEDGKQNPTEAIKQYQAVLTQFAEARQTAATALFRMAECYRKQGNRGAAMAAYQRVINEFADQPKLVQQSRTVLATTYQAPASDASNKSKRQQLQESLRQEKIEIEKARAAYRQTMLDEIEMVRKQIVIADQKYKAGVEGVEEGNSLRLTLIQRQRDLAAFDAGLSTPNSGRAR